MPYKIVLHVLIYTFCGILPTYFFVWNAKYFLPEIDADRVYLAEQISVEIRLFIEGLE